MELLQLQSRSREKSTLQLEKRLQSGAQGVTYVAQMTETGKAGKTAKKLVAKWINVGSYSEAEMSRLVQSIMIEQTLKDTLGSCTTNKRYLCFYGVAANDEPKGLIFQKIDFYYITNTTVKDFYLLYEYIDGVDLQEFTVKGYFISMDMILEILEGMDMLHRHRIFHRDMKPENIMITRYSCVRIIDFGMSCTFSDCLLSPMMGTPTYMSPECSLLDSTFQSYALSQSPPFATQERFDDVAEFIRTRGPGCIDMFAVGVTIYNSYFNEDFISNIFEWSGRTSMNNLSLARFMTGVSGTSYPSALVAFIAQRKKTDPGTAVLYDFLARLLTADYKTRMTAGEAVIACRNLIESLSPSSAAGAGLETASVSNSSSSPSDEGAGTGIQLVRQITEGAAETVLTGGRSRRTKRHPRKKRANRPKTRSNWPRIKSRRS
jgi:serine/threonine protein kinase